MSTGYGEGTQRVTKSIEDALNSPLLNNRDVYSAQKVLLYIYFSTESEVKMEEVNEINDFMAQFSNDIEVIWGTAIDDTLGGQVKTTLLATGFGITDLPEMPAKIPAKGRNNDEMPKPITINDNRDRIGSIYGNEVRETIVNNPARTSYFIFDGDDLDNDQLIEKVEMNPTFNRDKNFVRNTKQTFQRPTAGESAPAASQAAAQTTTISFS
jgi:cell division protein FtsZ